MNLTARGKSMMLKHLIVQIIFTSLALGTVLFGQEPRVTLGRMVIEIGMDQNSVLSEAEAKKQSLTGTPGNDYTAVVWDGEATGETGQVLGSIIFEAGKVDSVFKRWSPERTQRDVDVGNALFAVASEFVNAGRTTCTLATRTAQEPGQQDQIVNIKCGRRTIRVSTVRNDQYRILSTSVTEWVQ